MRSIALFITVWSSPLLAQEPPPATPPAETPPAAEAAPPAAETPAPEAAAATGAPAATAEAPATGGVKYDRGFVLSYGEDFELKIVGRVQSRWSMAYAEEDQEVAHQFTIFRARLTLEGHVFGKTDYKFQTEFGRGFVYLRDFYLDQPVGPVRLRVGQWKKPYSRQHITSSGSLQMVDRSVTDGFSGAGRDIGVAIHDGYEKSPEIEWALGVFNGTGERPSIGCELEEDMTMMVTGVACANPSNVPPDIGPTMVARIGYNMGGLKGYSESDLEGGPLRLGVAASYMVDLAEGKGDAMSHRLGGDLILKVQGASITGGAYLVSLPDAAGDRQNDFGFFGQAGYFFSPKQFEVAGRFSMIPAGADDLLEALACFNWFFQEHALKWQTEAGILHTTSEPQTRTEVVVRSQAQLIF